MKERRFIEEYFPVKEVSAAASKGKNTRLHHWWAWRPLAVSRATTYASLIPVAVNAKEIDSQKQSIVELSRQKSPVNKELINRAKQNILKYNQTAPVVLDPFSGGGSIPLEALRLGCKTYATDYNPVATLIVKATTEYPFRQIAKQDQLSELKNKEQFPLGLRCEKMESVRYP